MTKILVTGAAGFVGSHICDSLIKDGKIVIGIDNLSTGNMRNLDNLIKNENFELINEDILNVEALKKYSKGVSTVYHMAANADIRHGVDDPNKDISQNIIGTFNVLEAIRQNGIKEIIFASSAAALGEPSVFPTPENCPVPIQTSIYGASKMSCEGLISSYCEGYGVEGYIFRFVSLLGPRYPHGHVIDFVRSLVNDPSELKVLGDGTQRKSYLHIKDCIQAINHVVRKQTASESKHRVETYHLGTEEYIRVSDSVGYITEAMEVDPLIHFGISKRGWVGDNPFVFLDIQKIKETGWEPKFSIEQSIKETTHWLLGNKWIL